MEDHPRRTRPDRRPNLPRSRYVLAPLLLAGILTGCGSGAGVELPSPLGESPMQAEVTQVLNGRLVSVVAARFRPDTCDERLIARMGPALPGTAPRSTSQQLDALPSPARTAEESVIQEITLAGRRYLTMSSPSNPSAATEPNMYGGVDIFGSPLVTRRDFGIGEEPDLGLLRLAAGAGVCDRLLAVWAHALVRRDGKWSLDETRAEAVFDAQAARWSSDTEFSAVDVAGRAAGVVIERLDVYVDDLGKFRLAEIQLRLPVAVPPTPTGGDEHTPAPTTSLPASPDYLVETWTIMPSRPPVLVQPGLSTTDRPESAPTQFP